MLRLAVALSAPRLEPWSPPHPLEVDTVPGTLQVLCWGTSNPCYLQVLGFWSALSCL